MTRTATQLVLVDGVPLPQPVPPGPVFSSGAQLRKREFNFSTCQSWKRGHRLGLEEDTKLPRLITTETCPS